MGKFYSWLGAELSLYTRHLAWLNAVPKREGKRALASPGAAQGEEEMSRGERIRAAGNEPRMPPCSAPIFIAWLFDAGPYQASSMGKAALSPGWVAEWEAERGIRLEPWQRRLLRRLSGDYLAEGDRATKHDCPPPWQPSEMTPHSREVVSAKIKSVFARMLKRQAENANRRG